MHHTGFSTYKSPFEDPHLVFHTVPRPTQTMKFPFAHGNNPYIKCDFHSGVTGQSIENCRVFQEKVQDLLGNKLLIFTGTKYLPWSSSDGGIMNSKGFFPVSSLDDEVVATIVDFEKLVAKGLVCV
ncbi:hypothetical protein KIW84_011668 [Lathyrus oleraceus]|uniref:Uncharacterized protein n=1 Tax=Pisum sativum TaxID=3888 RepID=A0A9D5BFN5_PEA|nr:hypothetical protein KIW84_011668 [Pisum sativum]